MDEWDALLRVTQTGATTRARVVEVTRLDGAGPLTRAYGDGMAPFVVQHDSPLDPAAAWARLTDWPAHGRFVPLTSVVVDTPGPTGVGTVFTGWTGLGRARFADVMEVVTWDPPGAGDDPRAGACRLEKRGRVVLGWAELSVAPRGQGCRVVWREEATPAHLPGFLAGVNATGGRVLFGRVVRGLLRG